MLGVQQWAETRRPVFVGPDRDADLRGPGQRVMGKFSSIPRPRMWRGGGGRDVRGGGR